MAMAKALIRKAKQDGFNISVKETGVTLVDGGEFPDLNDIEMERLRTLWTEVSTTRATHYSTTHFSTDR